MTLDGQEPQHAVVHDGVDVGGDGIVSPQGQQRPPLDIRVGKQIAVDKQALIGVARPDPLVPLHAVDEENAAAQAEGIRRHAPDPGHSVIAALKRGLDRYIDKLMDGRQFDPLTRNKSEMHSAAGATALRVGLPAIVAVLAIQRFLP